jgi:hypothetical protein
LCTACYKEVSEDIVQPFGGKEQVASRLAKARAETAEADEQRKLSAGALNSSLKSQSESYAAVALTSDEVQDSRYKEAVSELGKAQKMHQFTKEVYGADGEETQALYNKVILLAAKAKELKPAIGKKADCQRKIKQLTGALAHEVGQSERLKRMVVKCSGQLEEIKFDASEQDDKVAAIQQQLDEETLKLQGFDQVLALQERADNAPHLTACISEVTKAVAEYARYPANAMELNKHLQELSCLISATANVGGSSSLLVPKDEAAELKPGITAEPNPELVGVVGEEVKASKPEFDQDGLPDFSLEEQQAKAAAAGVADAVNAEPPVVAGTQSDGTEVPTPEKPDDPMAVEPEDPKAEEEAVESDSKKFRGAHDEDVSLATKLDKVE